jgi:UDP-N-acetylmuramoyl-tripeptide--D-alanyl-D-alanine ligase
MGMENMSSIEKIYNLFKSCHQVISTDTRKIKSGSIFFALKGENFNANEFAEEALKKGCEYAIIDDENYYIDERTILVIDVLDCLQELAKHHRKKLKFPIIGITGSNAKTTHKELINAVLQKKYNTYATKGNLNNHIGVPLSILELSENHEIAIIEMGANHQGEIALLSSISDPDYGIITNIGKAHLEGFGGVEGIKKGKGELYNHLLSKKGKIFINGDDCALAELAKGLEQIPYGIQKDYFIHGKLNETTDQVSFQWNTKGNSIDNKQIIQTNMYGRYNFINMLCAVCVGYYFGIDEKNINDALIEYIPEMNRSQTKQTKSNTLILDAYNANPSSMKLAIDNFNQSKINQNKIVIIGDMFELGDYAESEHLQILEQLSICKFNETYLIGNEFYKQKELYKSFHFLKKTDDLISYINNNPLENNTILIKGSRSMKLEQIVDFL